MTSETFLRRAEKLGVKLKGISLGAAESLRSLATAPIPINTEFTKQVIKGKQYDNRRKSPAGSLSVGALIVHGLARLNAGQYVITDKGSEYLQKLNECGLFGSEKQITEL